MNTISKSYVDNGEKATKAKRHAIVHLYARPDGVREVTNTYYASEADARAAL